MRTLTRRRDRVPAQAFEAVPLVGVLMSLLGRRHKRAQPTRVPHDPDWDRDDPMTGLS
ncbi:MAG: hypothetical protein REI09_03495 [Candidatus Dactylopiibacterium sp.]|nr:hypothetical protein [Candidatus Dactylopiibacterium sp.]